MSTFFHTEIDHKLIKGIYKELGHYAESIRSLVSIKYYQFPIKLVSLSSDKSITILTPQTIPITKHISDNRKNNLANVPLDHVFFTY